MRSPVWASRTSTACLRLGSPQWFSGFELPKEAMAALQGAGKALVVLVEGQRALALLAIADPLRAARGPPLNGSRRWGCRW